MTISLFDHGNPEEFILFIRNCNMTLVATGNLKTVTKVHYVYTLVCAEALYHFDLLSDDVGTIDTYLTVGYLIKGLAWYFSL